MRLHRRIFARALQRRCHTSPVHELPDEKDKSKRRGVAAPFDSWPVIRVLVTAALLFATASLALAQTQSSTNRSRAFGPDACGPADAAYIHTANETGGIPMFLQRSEAAKAFHLVRESTRNNVATVFWATGTLDAKQILRVPVDSLTKRITFTFSGDTKGNEFKVTQPSGGAITESSSSTEVTELNCGRILTVASPEAGEWLAEITGKGRYWIEAQGQSDIFFVSVGFGKKGGRPGHEGLFRMQGQPLVGAPATLQASLSASATKATEFYLVNEQGHTIQKLPMDAVNSDRQFLEFVGSMDLPNVPFRIAVMGRDSNDTQYQRFFASLFHAESVSVEVSAKPGVHELSPGTTMQIAFTVRNIGFPRTFKITVTDTQKFLTNAAPKELALGAGESGTVQVELTVPAATASGVGDDLVIVAASTAGPPTSNSSVVHLSVSSSGQNPR